MEHIIFISIGVVIFLVFLGSMSIVHIRTMRDDLNTRWYNLADKLQYRQDLMPNLVETIRLHIPDNKKIEYERIIDQSIQVRDKAGKNAVPGAEKIAIEHSLSGNIKQLLDLAIENRELSQNTNFLELRKEFKEISKEIEEMSNEYNVKVRHHNRSVKRIYNLIPVLLMRYSKKKIFEFE
ncbi:hypothetical protein C0416_04105 [bacterium]|nr:hypothetical protein [bacterium]